MPLNNSFCIAALPVDIVWADRDANLSIVENAIAQMPEDVDLVVLPELFSTGYINAPQHLDDLPETNSGVTMEAVHELARRYNCAIAGSFLARTSHNVYNRAFFIEPSGDASFYDKHHLFTLSDEARTYTRGMSAKPVIRFRGWNIAMIVCYDLRFPVWCRNRGNEYDILIVPANWASSRGYAWKQLLIARAIENQAYVAGANRGGSDDYGNYEGMTFIIDPKGAVTGEMQAGCNGAVIARLSKDYMDEWRRHFPASSDADPFRLTDIPG